jgi:hypothetical protein
MHDGGKVRWRENEMENGGKMRSCVDIKSNRSTIRINTNFEFAGN